MGQALKIPLLWSGPVGWVACSLFISPGWYVGLLSSGILLRAVLKGYLLSQLLRVWGLGSPSGWFPLA